MSSACPSGVSAIPFAFVPRDVVVLAPERELENVGGVRQAAGPAERDLVEERLLRVREPGGVPGHHHVVHERRCVPERVGGKLLAGARVDHAGVSAAPAGHEQPAARVDLHAERRRARAFAERGALARDEAHAVDVAVRA